MKEITKITTVQITRIFEVSDVLLGGILEDNDILSQAIETCMKKHLGADDVTVIKMQDFVRDIEPKE